MCSNPALPLPFHRPGERGGDLFFKSHGEAAEGEKQNELRPCFGHGSSISNLRECWGAGMVSMLPTVDSRTFAIQGGNRLLPEALLKNASVVMLSGAAVTEISTDASGLFHVSLAKSAQVVLALLKHTVPLFVHGALEQSMHLTVANRWRNEIYPINSRPGNAWVHGSRRHAISRASFLQKACRLRC